MNSMKQYLAEVFLIISTKIIEHRDHTGFYFRLIHDILKKYPNELEKDKLEFFKEVVGFISSRSVDQPEFFDLYLELVREIMALVQVTKVDTENEIKKESANFIEKTLEDHSVIDMAKNLYESVTYAGCNGVEVVDSYFFQASEEPGGNYVEVYAQASNFDNSGNLLNLLLDVVNSRFEEVVSAMKNEHYGTELGPLKEQLEKFVDIVGKFYLRNLLPSEAIYEIVTDLFDTSVGRKAEVQKYEDLVVAGLRLLTICRPNLEKWRIEYFYPPLLLQINLFTETTRKYILKVVQPNRVV